MKDMPKWMLRIVKEVPFEDWDYNVSNKYYEKHDVNKQYDMHRLDFFTIVTEFYLLDNRIDMPSCLFMPYYVFRVVDRDGWDINEAGAWARDLKKRGYLVPGDYEYYKAVEDLLDANYEDVRRMLYGEGES